MSKPAALKRFLRLPLSERRVLWEAGAWLLLTRVALKVLPFRWIAWALRTRLPQPAPLTAQQTVEARRIGWAVTSLSKRPPFRAVCLGQAIAAQSMLKRRRIPSAVHLGVANTQSRLAAHAWTTTGDLFVTGEADHEEFTEVSRIGASV